MTLRIGPALVQDAAAYQRWTDLADPEEYLWEALGLESGCLDSDRCFEEALAAASPRTDRAIRTFLIGWKAEEVKKHDLTQEDFFQFG